MQSCYWSAISQGRPNRRRVLRGAAGLGAGAAALALLGCGSNGEKDTRSENGLISQPVDRTANAKAGGVLKHYRSSDILHFDVLSTTSAGVIGGGEGYLRLLKFAAAKYPKSAEGNSEGDLSESWEVSPDRLQVTFKLRPNVTLDRRPPTNGRQIDAQDVLFSWNKFAKLNQAAQNLVYDAEKAPAAPVDSISAPDSRTIVFKLKQFDSSMIPFLSSSGSFYIMPREADGGYNPRSEIRGAGPWLLDEYLPSARLVWRRNPDYYVKSRPFIDKVEVPIVVDQSQRLAQFKAGNIYTDVVSLSPQDVIQTWKDARKSELRQADSFLTRSSPYFTFGYEGDSPFKDGRLRQALSMLIDRESYADVIENRDQLRREGLQPASAYNSVVSAGWTGFWLDPNNEKAFGENHKFLKYNVPEAKKLMSAAGRPGGFEFDLFYNTGDNYGAAYHQARDVYVGMFIEGGAKPRLQGYPYSQYQQSYYYGYLSKDYAAGKVRGYNGVLFLGERTFSTLATQLSALVHKDGSAFHGLSPDGKNAHLGDPKLNDIIVKIRAEPDLNRQESLVHELTRYFTGQTYTIPRPVHVKNLTVWWPAIGNQGVYRTYSGGDEVSETQIHWWIDETKAPLA